MEVEKGTAEMAGRSEEVTMNAAQVPEWLG